MRRQRRRWHDGPFSWLGAGEWERVRASPITAGAMSLGTDNGVFRMKSERVGDAEAVMTGVAVSAVARGSLWLMTEGGVTTGAPFLVGRRATPRRPRSSRCS